MVAPVSLVITTYNRQQYLGAAIASVLAQTYRDFTLLVWDDGSGDRSLEIAQSYARRDSRIQVMTGRNQGQTRCLQHAIAQTQGAYLGWLDDDDLLAPTALAQTVAVLDARPEVGWVYTDYVDIDAHNRVLGYGQRCRIPYSPLRILVDFMTFHFRLMRRSLYEQVGGLKESPKYAQDYDLSLKLAEVCSPYHVAQPLYFYRRHQQTVSIRYAAQQRQEVRQIIQRSLERRGLASEWQLVVSPQRFILRRRTQTIPLLPLVKPLTLTKGTGVVLATLPLMGLMADRAAALVAPPPGQLSSYRPIPNTPLSQNPAVASPTTAPTPDTALLPQFAQPMLLAQAITPADDGTNTAVTQQGNQFDITGGQSSADQANLFHSFEQFGLSAGQIANFISRPEIQNIVGRVVGGDASVINGLLQVTGGNSNLYLVNPAGILVGPNAQLNVPAALTLSTANSIGFGDQWFNVTGSNNYAALNGTPSQFAFTTSQPGAVINTGNLAVNPGQTLSLMGGTVVNTGQLTASGGQILLSSVPGESRIRLSQPGHLLSLELETGALPDGGNLPAIALPALLTGQNTPGLAVNQAGQAVLTTTNTVIPQGNGVTLASGSLDVSSSSGMGGAIAILGDRVGLFNASLNASGQTGGGQIRVGGDYQGQGTLPTASQTTVNGGSTLSADALGTGDGGRVILWANDVTRFHGSISAQGGTQSGNGGFVEVSSPGLLDYQGQVNTAAANGTVGTLLLDPTNIEVVGSGYDMSNLSDVDQFSDPDLDSTNQVTRLGVSAIKDAFANVALRATNNVTFNADTIVGFGYGLTVEAGNTIEVNNPITLQGQNNLQFRAGNNILLNADLQEEGGEGGGDRNAINLQAGNLIEVNGLLNFASSFDTSVTASAGNAIAVNQNIQLNRGNFSSSSRAFNAANHSITTRGGNITINASDGSATVGNLDTSAFSQGGAVSITATDSISTGNITTKAITGLTFPSGNGGDVFLDPQGDIQVGFIDAQGGTTGVGGTVDITTQQFFRATQTFIDQNGVTASISTAGGQSGDVTIRHGGGPVRVPFTVGPDYNGVNGTAGAITTGANNTISSGSFPQSYAQGTAPGSIQIITGDPRPSEDPKQPIPINAESSLNPTTKTEIKTLSEARNELQQIEDATGIKPALVYVQFVPRSVQRGAAVQDITANPETGFTSRETRLTQSFEAYLPLPDENTSPPVVYPSDDDQLELMVITAKGNPIWKRVDVPRSQLLATAQKFRLEVADPRKTRTESYLPSAQALYQWVIAPIQTELAARGIANLTFLPDPGLRSVPWAALHDGRNFLIENYSVGLMPSLSLADTRYVDIRNTQLLAMGASQFATQRPLPAVQIELQNLGSLWQGMVLPEDQFNFATVRQLRQVTPYGIVHMATHGEFKAGKPQDSYIQLKDTRLHLDQIRQLGWNNPPLELLVLSACRTALGDERAELGFAGLSVQAGVKSAMASLWYVSDVGTLALITEFYRDLHDAPKATIKAEALRQAQLELLHKSVYLDKGQLVRGGESSGIPIRSEFSGTANSTLQHPYYWAAFTMIGSPW